MLDESLEAWRPISEDNPVMKKLRHKDGRAIRTHISLRNNDPVRTRPYRISPEKLEPLKEKLSCTRLLPAAVVDLRR